MVEPNMELRVGEVRACDGERVEQGVPRRCGNDQDVVRWGLGLCPDRCPDGLEQRVGLRDVDDPGHGDSDRL
jgi:hypothetical protein